MTTILETYMRQAELDDAALGEMIGKDRTTVSRIRRGVLRPTLDVAASIEAATNGAVPMKSWVESPTPTGTRSPFPKRRAA